MTIPSPSATDVSPVVLPASTLPNGRVRLSVQQAADVLGMGKSTLERHINEGVIQSRKIGGQRFMLWPDDIDAVLDAALQPASRKSK
ncbi:MULTISPECIES: helix-turn-helix domain-containing protein [unclassified Nocardioides]|uniref:helix-turn-helix domain-containing protein n=1 Tax=unclassified Nocardioides TaxID=2615069 RepID=UPI003014C376